MKISLHTSARLLKFNATVIELQSVWFWFRNSRHERKVGIDRRMEWDEPIALCTRMWKMDWFVAEELQHKRLDRNNSFSSTRRQCHLHLNWKSRSRWYTIVIGLKIWKLSDREKKRQHVWVGKGHSNKLMAAVQSLRDIGPSIGQCSATSPGVGTHVVSTSNNGESERLNFDKRIKILLIRETEKPCQCSYPPILAPSVSTASLRLSWKIELQRN